MNRRNAIQLIGASGLSMGTSLVRPGESMLAEFMPRWNASRNYTLALMDAMPEEHYDFKPTPEQMSFGGQFTHIGFFNAVFFGMVKNKSGADISTWEGMMKAEFIIPEPENKDKQTAKDYVIKTYDRCSSYLSEMSEEDLASNEYAERQWWISGHSNRDLLLRALGHTGHHRGQAAVYLRLKGITPPSFAELNHW